MDAHPRIAISQPYIIAGGRLQVILGITRILNDQGIVPDWLTFGILFDPGEIEARYGYTVKFNLRRLVVPRLPQDSAILLFHTLLHYNTATYDLLINTSNSLLWLPNNVKVLTYMFYPRKGRIMLDAPDIHFPDEPLNLRTRSGIEKMFLRPIYRRARPKETNPIVCMTQFTCDALHDVYDNLPANMEIVYPAVDTKQFEVLEPIQRQPAVVSIGRFSRGKRQLEQVKLAETLPELSFHIVGFMSDYKYFEACKRFVDTHQLTNVHLHPNAPFPEMVRLLQESKFFLHTMVNEPFGLTPVQAIAAGCMPIVHDSGGQREIVIEPMLRYQTLEDVPRIIEWADSLSQTDSQSLLKRLQSHATVNFDEQVFYRKMEKILLECLS